MAALYFAQAPDSFENEFRRKAMEKWLRPITFLFCPFGDNKGAIPKGKTELKFHSSIRALRTQ